MTIRTFAAMLALGAAAPVGATAAKAAPQTQSASVSAVTYFESNTGKFERSVTMRFPSLPRIADEIRAGRNIYRVTRVLHLIEGEQATETRLYFERVGPAEVE